MKKTLLKVLSGAIALTLVATAAIKTAPKKEIPVQDINTRPAQEEAVKENTVLDLIEEKVQEEKTIEVKSVKAPVAETAKSESVKKAAPEKAAEEVAVPVVAPVVKEAAAPETPAEPEAPKAEEIAAPEIIAEPEEEPVMVWDISATEEDSVAMAFYAAPAEARAIEQVEVDSQTGTVYIRGTGAMEDSVYSHFMTTEKYLTAVKALFEEHYGFEVRLDYDENLQDVLELDSNIRYFAAETGEELFVTEEMRQSLTPDAFLEYSPKAIVIEEGITNVSDFAFVCCADLETVVLPSTIEAIGECAFEHCDSLISIVIPENAAIDDTAFVYCDSLSNVQLVNADYYANGGIATVHADGENTGLNALTAEEIYDFVHYWD